MPSNASAKTIRPTDLGDLHLERAPLEVLILESQYGIELGVRHLSKADAARARALFALAHHDRHTGQLESKEEDDRR